MYLVPGISRRCSWSQLPVCQVRVRPKPTKGYPTYCVPVTCYLSWMLSCAGVRRVVLLPAMCCLISVPRERNVKGTSHTHSWSQLPVCQVRVRLSPTKGYPTWMYLVPVIWYGCYRERVYDVLSCCQRCADWYRYRVKGMPKVRHILTHSPNYFVPKCQVRVRLNPTKGYPTWMYLVPVISRGCYRVWMYDVLCCCQRCADWYRYRVKGVPKVRAVVTYSSWSQLLPECNVPVSSAMLLMVPTTRVTATGVDGHEPAVTVTSTITCKCPWWGRCLP